MSAFDPSRDQVMEMIRQTDFREEPGQWMAVNRALAGVVASFLVKQDQNEMDSILNEWILDAEQDVGHLLNQPWAVDIIKERLSANGK